MRSKSGFQPSVPVMNQGGALDRAAKSDALIADCQVQSSCVECDKMCIHKSKA